MTLGEIFSCMFVGILGIGFICLVIFLIKGSTRTMCIQACKDQRYMLCENCMSDPTWDRKYTIAICADQDGGARIAKVACP